jgi:hypothetical protein
MQTSKLFHKNQKIKKKIKKKRKRKRKRKEEETCYNLHLERKFNTCYNAITNTQTNLKLLSFLCCIKTFFFLKKKTQNTKYYLKIVINRCQHVSKYVVIFINTLFTHACLARTRPRRIIIKKNT